MITIQKLKSEVREGFALNPKRAIVNEIIDDLNKNGGRCPNASYTSQCGKKHCPCSLYTEKGDCPRDLFVRDEKVAMDRLEFAIDLETLSRRPNAAIISIAVKPFSLDGKKIKATYDCQSEFYKAVDANSCIMRGMDVEPATCEWWASQPEEVKRKFSFGYDVRYVLTDMLNYIEGISKANGAKEIYLWCQGTDFDIPILGNALRVVFGDDYEQKLSWKYNNVVDARTFVKFGLDLLVLTINDIPSLEGYVKHDALSDVNKLIHNVTWVYSEFKKELGR